MVNGLLRPDSVRFLGIFRVPNNSLGPSWRLIRHSIHGLDLSIGTKKFSKLSFQLITNRSDLILKFIP